MGGIGEYVCEWEGYGLWICRSELFLFFFLVESPQ